MTTDTTDDARPADEPGASTDTADTDTADTHTADTDTETTASGTSSEPGDAGGGRGTREMPFADNIHGLVDDILEGVRNFTPVASVRYPRYDFVETPGAYLLAFDLPGVDRDAISVTTEGEDVVLSGERTSPDWGGESTVRRRERAFGSFRRAMRMPADVRIDDIRAKLEDGILTVTLPRHAASTARKVDIEA
ncbi:MAG TPA: Hsp20/alpha crystallin family protein [Alphaproteobacteria bacterium]|nr:Hsp20/alpha crystallin family protein [Alphaproteobacteria bacterium]